jgi:hypothetical protein
MWLYDGESKADRDYGVPSVAPLLKYREPYLGSKGMFGDDDARRHVQT